MESANRQLRETVDQLATARSLARVELVQRRIDLEAEIASLGHDGGSDLSALEAGFVAAAKSYSERKGITTQAWLQGGVPRSVLRQAGQIGSGGWCQVPHPAHRLISRRCCSRPRKWAAES